MPFDLNEKYILAAEMALGVRLPQSYRRVMSNSNGGSIEINDDDWELYPIEDTSERKRIARSVNNIVTETKLARDWTGFPKDAIALASNGEGDQLVLIGANPGQSLAVFIWRHETREIIRIADDFAELWPKV